MEETFRKFFWEFFFQNFWRKILKIRKFGQNIILKINTRVFWKRNNFYIKISQQFLSLFYAQILQNFIYNFDPKKWNLPKFHFLSTSFHPRKYWICLQSIQSFFSNLWTPNKILFFPYETPSLHIKVQENFLSTLTFF